MAALRAGADPSPHGGGVIFRRFRQHLSMSDLLKWHGQTK